MHSSDRCMVCKCEQSNQKWPDWIFNQFLNCIEFAYKIFQTVLCHFGVVDHVWLEHIFMNRSILWPNMVNTVETLTMLTNVTPLADFPLECGCYHFWPWHTKIYSTDIEVKFYESNENVVHFMFSRIVYRNVDASG